MWKPKVSGITGDVVSSSAKCVGEKLRWTVHEVDMRARENIRKAGR